MKRHSRRPVREVDRDDFSTPVKTQLRERVNGRCSNPDCDAQTQGAGNAADTIVRIGQAAHITAAASRGPRYDHDLTAEGRASINNGIWLCNNCARMIDADEAAYPARLLRRWKELAEALVRSQLGKPKPKPDDAVQMLNAVLGGQPTRFLPQAVANVHRATEQSLNSLDSRFRVTSQYVNKASVLDIRAITTAKVSMCPSQDHAHEWQEALTTAIEHGEEVTVPIDNLEVSGSPLFEALLAPTLTQGAKLTITGKPTEAIHYCSITDPISGERTQLPDTHGSFTVGTKTFTYKGCTYDGILKMRYQRSWSDTQPGQAVSFTFDFSHWEGRDVRHLPHFNSMRAVVLGMAAGHRFEFEASVDGQVVHQSRSAAGAFDSPEMREALRQVQGLLEYVADLRTLSEFVSVDVRFRNGVPIATDDWVQLKQAIRTATRKRVYRNDELSAPPSFAVKVGERDDALALLTGSSGPRVFRITEPEGAVLRAFGQDIRLPILETYILNASPRLTPPVESLKVGDTVHVELLAADGFLVDFAFAKQ